MQTYGFASFRLQNTQLRADFLELNICHLNRNEKKESHKHGNQFQTTMCRENKVNVNCDGTTMWAFIFHLSNLISIP